MKTAEEWLQPLGHAHFQDRYSYDGEKYVNTNRVEVVKQIQLDAIQEGMRRAANLVWDAPVCPPPDGLCGMVTRESMKKAILTAAEQLTTKDL